MDFGGLVWGSGFGGVSFGEAPGRDPNMIQTLHPKIVVSLSFSIIPI